MNTSEVLNRAADLIQERGWARDGGWVTIATSDTDPLCLEGGILAALGWKFGEGRLTITDAPFRSCAPYQAVKAYVERREQLNEWNDAEERTQADVIEVLRACAVIEASREREAAEVSPEAVTA